MDFAPKALLGRSRLAILVLAVVTPACTASDDSNRAAVDPAPEILIPDGAADRLAGAVRIATISHADTAAFDAAAFNALHDYLEKHFPRAHTALQREKVGYSLLYTWSGSDPSLKPGESKRLSTTEIHRLLGRP